MVGTLITRTAIAGAALIVAEALYAVLRPSPELEEFDPSGDFGEGSKPTLRIAVLGDSSVTAPGVSGPDDIWVRLISTRLADRFHVVLKSFAVGGSTAADLVRLQVQPALALDPDIIFVSVGANDAIRGRSRRRFAADLEELVRPLASSGAIVIQSGVGDIGTIPRLFPPLRGIMTRRSVSFDRVHKEIAAKHGAHVVEQRMDGRKIWLEDRDLWAPDLFHVSPKGHQRWANVAWPTVEPLVARFDGSS